MEEEGWLGWKLARKRVRQLAAVEAEAVAVAAAAHNTAQAALHSTACFPSKSLFPRQSRTEPKMLCRLKMGSTGSLVG